MRACRRTAPSAGKTCTRASVPYTADWYKRTGTATITATDAESGVASIDWKLDGVSGSRSSGDAPYPSSFNAQVPISTQGKHTLEYWAVDVAGNETTPHVTAAVDIDTKGPTTAAPAAVTAKRGVYAALKFRVSDNLGPTVAVTVRVMTTCKHPQLVRTLTTTARADGSLRSLPLLCDFKKGKYKFYVCATDLAGNVQTKVGSNNLTVK